MINTVTTPVYPKVGEIGTIAYSPYHLGQGIVKEIKGEEAILVNTEIWGNLLPKLGENNV